MKIKLIITTTDSKDNAQNISIALVSSKLSPCVQILSNISSIYRWEGKIEKTNEYLLLIKVLEKNLNSCKKNIIENHNYSTPEIIEVSANTLSDSYATWFQKNSE